MKTLPQKARIAECIQMLEIMRKIHSGESLQSDYVDAHARGALATIAWCQAILRDGKTFSQYCDETRGGRDS